MIVYVISQAKPGKTMDDLNRYIQGELKQDWEMFKNDVIRAIHLRTDAIGVVLTLEVENVEAAKKHCDNFPLVKNGIIDLTYIPVAPFTLWEYMQVS
jgi:hypothetical protein